MILDLIYPPLCLFCKERCSTKHLCPSCWELSAPIDPAERCRHCFSEKEGLCQRCRPKPALPVPRASVFDRGAPIRRIREPDWDALAGFAYVQWLRLDWPSPDALIPLNCSPFAKAFARLLERPLARSAEEDQILLLLDAGNCLATIQKKVAELFEAFPKRVFLFSLFHEDF